MKRLTSAFQTLLLTSIIFSAAAVYNSTAEAHSAVVLNRIEGIVWDPYRRPVRDLYVELQNENYFALTRVRTDSTGRFSFIGVSAGRFNIRVITSGTNYLEYNESVDLVSVVRGGSDAAYLEIVLKLDKSKVNSGLAEI